MEPLSIAAGCAGLLSSVTSLSLEIVSFVSSVRDARKDMDAVSRELTSLSLCVQTLRSDSPKINYPDGFRENLLTVLRNCDTVTAEMAALLKKLSSVNLLRKIQWSTTGKDEMNRLRSSLESHKSALEIGLDMSSLLLISAVKDDVANVKNDVADVKADTAHIPSIKQDTSQIEGLVQQINLLRLQIEQSAMNDAKAEHLQSFLAQSTTYAETVIDSVDNDERIIDVSNASVPNRARENMPSTDGATGPDAKASQREVRNFLLLGETRDETFMFLNTFANHIYFASLDNAIQSDAELSYVAPFSFSVLADGHSEHILGKEIKSGGEYHDIHKRRVPHVFPVSNGMNRYHLIDIGCLQTMMNQERFCEDVCRKAMNLYDDIHGVIVLLKPERKFLNIETKNGVKLLLQSLHKSLASKIVFGIVHRRLSCYTPGSSLEPLKEFLHSDIKCSFTVYAKNVYNFDNEGFRYLAIWKSGLLYLYTGDLKDPSRRWHDSALEQQRMLDYLPRPHPTRTTRALLENSRITKSITPWIVKILVDISLNIEKVERALNSLSGYLNSFDTNHPSIKNTARERQQILSDQNSYHHLRVEYDREHQEIIADLTCLNVWLSSNSIILPEDSIIKAMETTMEDMKSRAMDIEEQHYFARLKDCRQKYERYRYASQENVQERFSYHILELEGALEMVKRLYELHHFGAKLQNLIEKSGSLEDDPQDLLDDSKET